MNEWTWLRSVWLFLTLAMLTTGLCGLIYLAVQQNYRQSLNDPQIQIAEDAAAKISSGVQIDQVVPIEKIDIANSLSPYLIIYNNAGVPLLSSAELHGNIPTLPPGLLNDATWRTAETYTVPQGKETHVTWQPELNVRQALVLVHYTSANGIGFAVAGRNMRAVEQRIEQLGVNLFIGWTVIIIALLIAIFGGSWMLTKQKISF